MQLRISRKEGPTQDSLSHCVPWDAQFVGVCLDGFVQLRRERDTSLALR